LIDPFPSRAGWILLDEEFTGRAGLGSTPSAEPLIASDELRTSTQQSPCSPEIVMRSDQVHRALARGMNRFEVCRLVSKGVRVTHKSGSRFEDSINSVLLYLGDHELPLGGLHPAKAAEKLEPAA
jgi:hypothetical protein